MSEKNSKIGIKLTIFSIAFTLGLNVAGVSPILGLLNETFKNKGANAVQTLQTIPYFLLMIASILSGWLVTKISKKKLVVIGLFLIAFIGISPLIFDEFSLMMFSRMLVGFGFGVISPLNTSIISEFFQGKDRAAMMGIHVTGMGIGTMCVNIIGGILGKIGYKQFFLVHLIVVIAVFIVIIKLPDTGVEVVNERKRLKLNKEVYELSLMNLINTIFITAYMTNIGIHIVENMHGDSSITGFVTTINAVFALIVGLSFSKISSMLKQYTLSFSIFVGFIGFLCLGFLPTNMLWVLIASACCGISLSCFMAQATYMISNAVSQNSIALASGVFSLLGGIGGLISPVFLNGFSKAAFGSISTYTVFLICMSAMFILSLFSLTIVSIRQRKTEVTKELKININK